MSEGLLDLSNEQQVRLELSNLKTRELGLLIARNAFRVLSEAAFTPQNLRNEALLHSFRAIITAYARQTCSILQRRVLDERARTAATNVNAISDAVLDDLHPSVSQQNRVLAAAYSVKAAGHCAKTAISMASGVDGRAANDPCHSAALTLSHAHLSILTTFKHKPEVNLSKLIVRETKSSVTRLLQERIWGDQVLPQMLVDSKVATENLLQSDLDWTFWLHWYSQVWDGTFRDWELATEVALIPNEVWEGEDALAKVAEAIREIEAKRALSSQIEALREAEAHTSADTFRPARGHNNPPELIDEPQLVQRVEIVWTALDTIAQEAEAATPDKGKALQALVIVRDWFFAACIYVGRKADLMIDTTIKWGIPVLGGGYLATHPDKLQKIIELAEIWLKP